MNIVAHLSRTGAITAAHLARITGREVEAVYADLVREEAAGRVRVNVDGADQSLRRWEAMVPDDELPAPLRGGALEVF